MKLLENILVPIDFSESSDMIIDRAIKLAMKFGSQISIMHVVNENEVPEDLKKVLYEAITKKLNLYSEYIKSRGVIEPKIILENGSPFEKIIQEVQSGDYNVIVAGAGTASDKGSYKLGTTVEKIMRKNQVPLYVVKPDKELTLSKILCPVDFSEASLRALYNAGTLARTFDAKLFVLHVYEAFDYYSKRFEIDYKKEKQELKNIKKEKIEELFQKAHVKDLNPQVILVEGEPFLEILRYINKNHIDLLTMGTTGKTVLSRLLMGSVTEKVTRELPCDFITTKSIDLTEDYFDSNLESIELILNSAKKSVEKGQFELAIDKYTMGLKQYPDNLPILKELIEVYKRTNQKAKAEYFANYARKVIKRLWGEDYMNMFSI